MDIARRRIRTIFLVLLGAASIGGGPLGGGRGVAQTVSPGRDVLRSRLALDSKVDEKTGLKISEGTFAVYEDRSAGTGRLIHLGVVVLHAKSPEPKPDPVFVFAGGPGADIAQSPRPYLDSWVLEERDIVLVSQRGTGGDNRLSCRLAVNDNDIQGYLDPLFRENVFKPCLEELEKKFDLTKYSTCLAADDYNDAREALGYDRINVTGTSYGTRMALVYMRQHPKTVRTAILNGVLPIANKNPLYHAANFDLAIRALIAECANDPDCRAAVPNLDDEFHAILARLDAEPAATTVTHPVSGQKVRVGLSKETFLEALRVMMYSGIRNRLVPFLLHRAFEGDFEPFAELGLSSERNLRLSLALGHLLCVTCTEDVARITKEEIVKIAGGPLAGDGRVRGQKSICAFWPKSDIASSFGDPVSVDVPVLLLSGTLDPVTPPRWGEEAAGHLPKSRHLVVPGAHGVGSPCLIDIQKRFLAAGAVDGLDLTCTKDLTPAKFRFSLER